MPKISDLSAVSSLSTTDVFPVEQSDATRKLTIEKLKTSIADTTPVSGSTNLLTSGGAYNVKTTADTASSNAITALSTANAAANNAATALATANTASSTANTAINNAATALSTANNALSTSNKNASNFAKVENSSTASQAYAVGDFLVYNGLLYIVTVAIASGGTITPDTNCMATTAGAQISALNGNLTIKEIPITYSSDIASYVASTSHAWISGNTLHISFYVTTISSVSGRNLIATITLPDGYSSPFQVSAPMNSGLNLWTDSGTVININAGFGKAVSYFANFCIPLTKS